MRERRVPRVEEEPIEVDVKDIVIGQWADKFSEEQDEDEQNEVPLEGTIS